VWFLYEPRHTFETLAGSIGISIESRHHHIRRLGSSRSRRGFAANVLSDVLDSVNRKKTSIHQLFTNFDADKSGCLDTAEFRAAMLQISIKLSEFEVGEVMAEIDMDVSGSIDTQVPAE
jgi:hypothetical protein